MTRVMTAGTFDLFHIGHLRLLERARALGDSLVVAVSTDEFNLRKGKEAICSYHERAALVSSFRCVDLVIPETSWDKRTPIAEHNVSVFAIGDDWAGRFDDLSDIVRVVYLPRTLGISTSERLSNIRRLHARVKAVVPFELRDSSGTFRGQTSSLSVSGASLLFDQRAPDAARRSVLVLAPSTERQIVVDCVTAWLDERTAGVEFVELTDQAREALTILILQDHGVGG